MNTANNKFGSPDAPESRAINLTLTGSDLELFEIAFHRVHGNTPAGGRCSYRSVAEHIFRLGLAAFGGSDA